MPFNISSVTGYHNDYRFRSGADPVTNATPYFGPETAAALSAPLLYWALRSVLDYVTTKIADHCSRNAVDIQPVAPPKCPHDQIPEGYLFWTLKDYFGAGVLSLKTKATLTRLEKEIAALGFQVKFVNTLGGSYGQQFHIDETTLGIQIEWHSAKKDAAEANRLLLHEMFHARLGAERLPRILQFENMDPLAKGVKNVFVTKTLVVNVPNQLDHLLFGGEIRGFGYYPNALEYKTRGGILRMDFEHLDQCELTGDRDSTRSHLNELIFKSLELQVELAHAPRDVTAADKTQVLNVFFARMNRLAKPLVNGEEFVAAVRKLTGEFVASVAATYSMANIPTQEQAANLLIGFYNGAQRCLENFAHKGTGMDAFRLGEIREGNCGVIATILVTPDYLVYE